MLLLKVNDIDYINPEHIIRISKEKDKGDKGEDLLTSSWVIYTLEGKVKTKGKFNIKHFIRESR